MFCPKCAAQNIEGSSFCRVCGANISLVPQALTGRLPEAPTTPADFGYRIRRSRRNRNREPLSLERSIVNIFMGIGFIVAAIAVMLRIPDGVAWGWALFFPGFACLGRGIAAIVAAQKKSEQLGIAGRANAIAAQPNPAPMIMGRKTGEMVPPPPSVTEGTTRHLGADVVTKQRDS